MKSPFLHYSPVAPCLPSCPLQKYIISIESRKLLRFTPQTQLPAFLIFRWKGEGNYAENAFIRHSRRHRGTGESAVPASLYYYGVNQDDRQEAQEKLLGVLLAAAAALLCAAIDYFVKQEDEEP